MNRPVQISITIEPAGAKAQAKLISHQLLPDETDADLQKKITELAAKALDHARLLRTVPT